MVKNKGLTIEENALEKAHSIFEKVEKQEDFGNGRFVRNLLEKAKMKQATRIISFIDTEIDKEQLACYVS